MIPWIIVGVCISLSVLGALMSLAWQVKAERTHEQKQKDLAGAYKKRLMDETTRIWREARKTAAADAKREIQPERDAIAKALEKYVRFGIHAGDGRFDHKIVVEVSIDRHLFWMCDQGNQDEFRYIMRGIVVKLERELMSLNIERFREMEIEHRKSMAMRNLHIARGDPS